MPIYRLSEQSAAALRAAVAAGRRGDGVLSRGTPDGPPQATDVFVCRTPPAGIPAPSYGDTGTGTGYGTWTGTGTLDQPGVADCDVYRVVRDQSRPRLESVGFTQEVLNLGPGAVAGDSWIPVWRDRWGAWVTSPGGGPGGGAELPTPDHCVRWYSGYVHLGDAAISEGEVLAPRQLLGHIAAHPNGAHCHHEVGSGKMNGEDVVFAPEVRSLVGQTFPVTAAYGVDVIGDHNEENEAPGVQSLTGEEVEAIRARISLPLDPGWSWIETRGGTTHQGPAYHALDLGLPPPTPDSTDEVGAPVYNCVDSSDVATRVAYCHDHGGDWRYVIVLEHRLNCDEGEPWDALPEPPDLTGWLTGCNVARAVGGCCDEVTAYVGDVGNGTDTALVVEHGLGTADLIVQVRENATGEVIYPTVTIAPAAPYAVTLTFAADLPPPSANQYRVSILQGGGAGSSDAVNDGDVLAAGLTFPAAGLKLKDADGLQTLTITAGSNLSADRVLTFTTGDAPRNVTLSGSPTLADWFDQSVKAASTPQFAGVALADTGNDHRLTVLTGMDLTADRTFTVITPDANTAATFPATGTVALATGLGGGQTLAGGTGSGESLTLQGTTHATAGPVVMSAPTALTNTVFDAGKVRHGTSGTAAAGFGVGFAYELEDAGGSIDTAARSSAVWTTATHGAEAADYVVSTMRGGSLTEQARFTSQGSMQFAEISTPSTPAAGKVAVYAKSDGSLYSLDDAGAETELGGGSLPATPPSSVTLSAVPTWFLADTITHTDLTDADTEQDVVAYTLPAKGSCTGAFVRTKTAGSGGTLASLSVQFVINGSTAGASGDGMSANNVACRWWPNSTMTDYLVYSWSATTDVSVRFSSFGDDLDNVTAGEWEVFLLLSTLG